MAGEPIETVKEDRAERAILVAVDTGDHDVETSLLELKELAKTAGAEVVAELVQKRESPDKATYIGSGRAEELRDLCATLEADLVIADDEVTATQQRNLSDLIACDVIDRTALILDIFAARARSAEGRLQVELAQLQYRLPRLMGQGLFLSRQGGGIGTRGPGETKLESDRRHIRRRMASIRADLEEVEAHRAGLRDRRKKVGTQTVAIVGYTNAGKSTLLNTLTGADVLAEDKLFATLDPVSRVLKLPDGRSVLFIDTVGFVRRLPHQLVKAFHSTLEEAVFADVVLNVCDVSSPDAHEHLTVTKDLLSQLGCQKPIVEVLNKCDAAIEPPLGFAADAVCISAKTGEGIDRLLERIVDALPKDRRLVDLLLPFSEGALAERCRREGAVEREEYVPEGLAMTVTLGQPLLDLVKSYIVE